MDNEKNTNIKFVNFIGFLKAINIFVPEADPVLSEIELEKIAIDAKIGKIIDTGNIEAISLLIEENVIFSDANMEKFLYMPDNHKRLSSIPENIYYKFIDFNNKQIKKLLLSAFFEFDKILDQPNKINSHLGLNSEHKKVLKIYKAASNIIYIWGQKIFENDATNTSIIYEKAHEIFVKINKMKNNNKAELVPHLTIKNIINTLESSYSKYNKENFAELANRSRTLQLADINTIMAEDVTKKIHTFNPAILPKEAQTLFKDIKLISQDLQDHKKQLNTAQSLHFDNLYLKRLPDVIQEYITIPERYRIQLKINKDNPDSLLLSSLSEIKTNLHNMIMNLQQNNLNKMKISNTYLRNI